MGFASFYPRYSLPTLRGLHNTQLLERFKALEGFNAQDQETVIKLIDAMIVKQRVESAVQPLGRGKRR